VDLGLVGRANAGKTALFALVTGADAEIAPYPFTTREPARAMADVPDPRLDAIADVQDIPRRVPAQVQLVDIAGLAAGAGSGEGLGGAALGQLRQTDALVHVVRAFANAEVPHPEDRVDPVADAEAVDLELAVADREQLERRLERARKGARAGEPGAAAALGALDVLSAALDAGRPARLADDEAARALGAEMGLLTAKPVLYLANTDEALEPPAALAAHAEAQGAQALALPVGMELELAAMEPEEAAELAEELELGDVRGADAVVAAGYRLLDLVTFFTGSGPPEARAWPVRRGTTASAAAGRIHSDMERGFIRAEVIPWDALVAAGSFARAREEALLRMEGRDYVVQEGDVLQIRFNV
jgi:GTP-binding protein YchF